MSGGLLVVLQSPPSWPAPTIQDTVAAIVSQRAYRRALGPTLLERLLGWAADAIRHFFSSVNAVPYAKWIVLGVAVLAVLAISTRIVLGDAAEARQRRRVARVAGGGDPWAEAERLAAAGTYTEAAHLLYRGLVDRLAADEQLRPHHSKTSGDYARELQRRGSLGYADFRQFGRRYDRVLFDLGSCDAATYAALRETAARVIAARDRAA